MLSLLKANEQLDAAISSIQNLRINKSVVDSLAGSQVARCMQSFLRVVPLASIAVGDLIGVPVELSLIHI